MTAVTTTFLVLGGIGLVVLAVSVFAGDVLHTGHPDADGPFSVPAVAGFLGAFGFIGALAAQLAGGSGGFAVLVGGLVGLVAAVPTALLATRLVRAALRMRTDATPNRTDLLGQLGVVVTPIPVDGYGEVRISLGGQPVKLNARADSPVPLGAKVFVVAAPSDTSVVVEQTTSV